MARALNVYNRYPRAFASQMQSPERPGRMVVLIPAWAEGAAMLTRPIWNQLSAGAGVWGGVQPGFYRLDAGPRLKWRVGTKMRVHADYRQRLSGSAAPGSGPVLTLAGDF